MKLVDIGLLFGCCIGAYFVGSIPVGYIIARIAGIDDIRAHGSGNIGATNVARTLGIRYFLPVFALDFAKAYGTVALVAHYFPSPLLLYATAVAYLIGNGYSIFLHGTGGKGVAAAVGILTCYNPLLALCTFATWAVAFALTRTVGIASVVGAIAAPICALFLGFPWHGVLFVTTIGAWIIMRHYENIKNYFVA
jgi:acyl phosphate:glycerol-3-phosphate acyltransferase